MSDFYIETWWKVIDPNCFTERRVSGGGEWGGGYEEVLILFYLRLLSF